jgi:hypothetical protein
MLCSLQRREPHVIDYVKDEGVLLHATLGVILALAQRALDLV